MSTFTANFLSAFGVTEAKAPQVLAAWLRSFWYTFCSIASLYLLLMQGQTHGFTHGDPTAAFPQGITTLEWAQANTWPFILTQFISPALRAHAAASAAIVTAPQVNANVG
jgi:hypothetical protein